CPVGTTPISNPNRTIRAAHYTPITLIPLSLIMSSSPALESSVGTLHRRDYFYIGYQCEEIILGDEGNSSLRTTTTGQMYVEHLVPMEVTRAYPLLMIHGQGMTGTNFLNTPDGRLGWADYFMSKGYETHKSSKMFSRPLSSITDGRKQSYIPNGLEAGLLGIQSYASMVPSLSSDRETATKMKAAGTVLLDKIG
ncbi:hypothetical protein H0H93_013672, partial [Arthromyces matolae]